MVRRMRMAEGLRSEVLTAALDEAIAGKPERLYQQLGLHSGLPGTRANLTLANAFAVECAARGKAVDELIFTMVDLHPDVARGATEHEFLPLCAVLAIGARGAKDPAVRARAIQALHDSSEDARFRVRDAIPVALARIGEKMGDALVTSMEAWTDGFFQAAAVLLSFGDVAFLSATSDGDAIVARMDEAFRLAKDAPRSAARYPGYKALIDALGVGPASVATKYGPPVFEMLARWTKTDTPELRRAIEQNLASKKLLGRYADEMARVRGALGATTAAPRDPTQIVQGMRGRSKKRGRH